MSVQQVPLGDIISPATVRRAGSDEFPVLSMTMRSGLVDQNGKFKKRIASLDTSQYKVVSKGQLVVGFPIDEGVLAIQDHYERAIVSPAYEVWDIIDTKTQPAYLERYLRSTRALSYYKSKLRGTTARRRTLPREIFLAIPIPLPSSAEQRRIVMMLNHMEELRVKRREALAQLDHLTRSSFLDMFGDPLVNRNGWETRTIAEFGSVITGNTPPREDSALFGDHIEWVKPDNLNGSHDYATEASEGLSTAGKSVGRTAPAGSILVTCIAGSPKAIGNTAMVDREVAFNQQINAIIPSFADTWFLYVQLVVGKRLIQGASTGGMKGLVSKSRFEKIGLIAPPRDLQYEFGRKAGTIERLKEKQRAHLVELDTLFESLQHRVFRGEL